MKKEDVYLWKAGKLFDAHLHFGAFLDDFGTEFCVYAPMAKKVLIAMEKNNWQGENMHHIGDGIFKAYITSAKSGDLYKYIIDGKYKADPFAKACEKAPNTASKITKTAKYNFIDFKADNNKINIYEVHLSSWKTKADGSVYSYKELAEILPQYTKDMGYTHIEIMPLCEYPYDGSWGYQCSGYYAITNRYGSAIDFMFLVDSFHRKGIAVIFDWAGGHFCPDDFSLRKFDGKKLYETEKHNHWGTYKFDFSKGIVHSFLISNIMYLIETFNLDGIRVDGVSSMIYRDFDRDIIGERIDYNAIDFLKKLNSNVRDRHKNILMIAEESTDYKGVTSLVCDGGLGFTHKWNMGWMNDTLKYFSCDFDKRQDMHDKITFSSVYADFENYILPLSHDEVVHGKKSLINKMPGNIFEKFAGLRTLYIYQMMFTGAKLNFMGGEFAQFIEWKYNEELEWFIKDYPLHEKYSEFVKYSNNFYKEKEIAALQWIDADNKNQSIFIFMRGKILTIINMKPIAYNGFRIACDKYGIYKEVLNSDIQEFGGTGLYKNFENKTEKIPFMGKEFSISINLAPLSAICFLFEERKEMLFENKQEFISQYLCKFRKLEGCDIDKADNITKYNALVRLIKDKIYSQNKIENNGKQIYYFSMEFLVGKLLKYYLVSFDIFDMCRDALLEIDINIDDIINAEIEPGLGNGGLGRLASCFLDSFANLGINGHGNGMRYQYGLFKQNIENGYQTEKLDNWLHNSFPWEKKRADKSVIVKFKGYATTQGIFDYEAVLAVPYDVPMISSDTKTCNTLRLWSANTYTETLDMEMFNRGDYAHAEKYQAEVKAISYILYPEDSTNAGRELRLKQEYFMTSAGIQSIIRKYKKDNNKIHDLHKNICIHINDTHPALAVPELMRILLDDEKLSWNEAWNITKNTISYTNHTILPEALEKWDISLMQYLIPRIFMIIKEIDKRHIESHSSDTAIIHNGFVYMANLAIIGSYSVNGVAKIHSDILQKLTLNNFYKIYRPKFNNKTNGISHRRFLQLANPALSKIITDNIGDTWKKDASELSKLKDIPNIMEAKLQAKEKLAKYIKESKGIDVDVNSIFDIQVKRIHAYKRQLMNVFKIMFLYNKLKTQKDFEIPKITFIFAGKSAHGYVYAKKVIKLINSIAELINNDADINGHLKVVFLENFGVSLGEIIYPAADISEQISTASQEASGTGNMKFMMNGAITIGTMDGANVEMFELAGCENVKIFGASADEIINLQKNGGYNPRYEYENDIDIQKIVDSLVDGTIDENYDEFRIIYDEILNYDQFFVLKDFKDYVNTFIQLCNNYKNKDLWAKIASHGIAKSAFFSSDRAIKEYYAEIFNK